MAREIAEPVRQFITRYVHSAAQLEVLLLMRAMPERTWSVRDVARAQHAMPDVAERLLEDLRGVGLLAVDGEPRQYRYAPPDGLPAVIDGLADAYANRRVAVVSLIFASHRTR